MHFSRHRAHATPSAPIGQAGPRASDDQARALEHRHQLDEQQRAIRDSQPRPQSHRPRPPG